MSGGPLWRNLVAMIAIEALLMVFCTVMVHMKQNGIATTAGSMTVLLAGEIVRRMLAQLPGASGEAQKGLGVTGLLSVPPENSPPATARHDNRAGAEAGAMNQL